MKNNLNKQDIVNIKEQNKKIKYTFIYIIVVCVFVVVVLNLMDYYNLIPKEYYNASDFGIKTVYSDSDYNNNKIDDYSDLVLGARNDAKNHPLYISKYYADSYPPDNEGVCTDTIWRAFKNAGYSLRDMVDDDIRKYPEDYQDVTNRDKNIDFRRVTNLKVFFEKYAISLTTDYKEIAMWQGGDIVIFNDEHIGIISDRRNKDGISYVIHNGGQIMREEDFLKKSIITGHYRFDATKIDSDVLKKWVD